MVPCLLRRCGVAPVSCSVPLGPCAGDGAALCSCPALGQLIAGSKVTPTPPAGHSMNPSSPKPQRWVVSSHPLCPAPNCRFLQRSAAAWLGFQQSIERCGHGAKQQQGGDGPARAEKLHWSPKEHPQCGAFLGSVLGPAGGEFPGLPGQVLLWGCSGSFGG